ncbi:TIGR02300 family protein [Pseudovibrio ascidiaceicola]|uniref:TIGR02300 family protein n=1 Tax=Pseudovibrio ascidiaceicola TaxID=285279 RepID=A0A1I3VYG4_9HYPH|nr:TIGR02300 family protein [Pseudovibrio ascidiaceicola]SFJ99211.1 TIGR02300 family protein [Pseudovibrio ascidiaceicola]
MARPELGTKRLCAACGAKYYDLKRDPIICPKCGDMFDLGMTAKTAKAVKAVQKEEAKEALVKDDAELVSLEEADAEASGEDIPDLEDENISDDISGDDSDVFLDDEDDEDSSVPGIVVARDDDEV